VSYQEIYDVVRRIPPGRVATYGQVASLAGLPGHARQVGYALHALPEHSSVPWHRVVNAKGGISSRAIPGAELVQRHLLAQEGVRLNARGQVSLAQVRWIPFGRAKRLV
jgi:methylated-DNA-protein-cysteine methyltransferase-like protein